MKIENSIASLVNTNSKTGKSASSELMGKFSNYLDDVNKTLLDADNKMGGLACGKGVDDIPGAMIALEKSDISVKLLLAVRSKLISAYQDITRMPV